MDARTPFLLSLLAAPAAAQTDVLYTIARPAGAHQDWATHMFPLPDLDGDGVGELGLGTRTHGGGRVAWVHSGASGAELYELVTPGAVLFFGQSLVPVDDRDGDEVPDLVLVGTRSGASQSPDGRFHLHSGATGAFLDQGAPPAGIVLTEGPSLALGDVDGDGHVDILCRAAPVPSIGSPHLQLFSGATGAALYSGVAEDPSSSVGNQVARLEDRDGDGVDEFAATGLDLLGPRVDVRSGRTGQVLQILRGPGVGLLTGNLEPLVRTPDGDGDGLDDLAVGNFFDTHASGAFGVVRHFSSASGALLRDWGPTPGSSLVGFLMVGPGDLDLDGASDLLTVERRSDAQGAPLGTALLGFDLAGGPAILDQLVPELGGLHQAMIAPVPGADPEGFTSFADLEQSLAVVRVRRFAPEVGTSYCASTPNSTGEAATMRVLGTASIGQDHLLLEARDVVPSKFGIFFYGPTAVQVPFGQGFLCVGAGTTGVGRLPAEVSDASGRMTHLVDYASPPSAATAIAPSSTWHFQCWFRDPGMPTGSQTSDAVSVDFLP